MRRIDIQDSFEIAAVIVVSTAMLIYGAGKWMQFNDPHLIDSPVSQLTGMELMWAFYGYSKPYAILLGVAEVTGGVLLLIPRTRVLGGLLIAMIMSNVIVQDIVYGVNVGALKAAIIYMLLTIIILIRYKESSLQALRSLLVTTPSPANRWARLITVSIGVLLAIVIKTLEYYITH